MLRLGESTVDWVLVVGGSRLAGAAAGATGARRYDRLNDGRIRCGG